MNFDSMVKPQEADIERARRKFVVYEKALGEKIDKKFSRPSDGVNIVTVVF